MAYTIGETTAIPFWAEGRDFIGGRDPLGIQNSSVSIYSTLLPGLNNVTERLRYYGFYCWLLSSLKQKNISFKKPRDQHNYIRRAEYILALYMALHEQSAGNIAGIDYANKQVQNTENRVFNIKKGAEKHPDTIKGSVYWDFSSGALGQYYAGSMIFLGLIQIQDRYFFITTAGEEMGKSYGDCIDEESKRLFLRIIENGELYRKDAGRLSAFSLQTIIPGSAEWENYITLFLSADYPQKDNNEPGHTTYRRDTWLMFITFLLQCNNINEWKDFQAYIYKKHGFTGTIAETAAGIGWYYYSTNEFIHFSLESIFSILLKTIERNPVHINELVSSLTDICLNSLHNSYKIPGTISTSEFIALISKDLEVTASSNHLLMYLKEFNVGAVLARAIELILKIYQETKSVRTVFERFTYETGTREKRGTALEFYEEHIEKYLSRPLSVFIERTISKIINDHLYVAYLKMGNGEGQVNKLLAEDNYLVHIANIEPRFTTPRLGTVLNFLEDLKIMKRQDGKFILTAEGTAIYKKYKAV